jgi:hypothetical protein
MVTISNFSHRSKKHNYDPNQVYDPKPTSDAYIMVQLRNLINMNILIDIKEFFTNHQRQLIESPIALTSEEV